jgi:hypothetical protein
MPLPILRVAVEIAINLFISHSEGIRVEVK